MILLALLAVALCQWERSNLIVQDVNTNDYGWKAEHNKFSSWTLKDLQKMFPCQHHREHRDATVLQPMKTRYTAPASFNSKDKWPKCETIPHIRNQLHCGSCWAFGGSEALSDRFCIEQDVHMLLAPQDLVSCDYSDMGCDGGNLENEWTYMKNTGIVPDSCMPYTSGNGTVAPCPDACPGDPTKKVKDLKYHAKSFKHVGWFPFHREEEIMEEISSNGPVEVAFTVYEDFMQYKSGVYSHKSGQELGGHAVKAVGYGETSSDGTKYWIINNSWGPDWGMDGVFWIKKGVDECGIEADVYAGVSGDHP